MHVVNRNSKWYVNYFRKNRQTFYAINWFSSCFCLICPLYHFFFSSQLVRSHRKIDMLMCRYIFSFIFTIYATIITIKLNSIQYCSFCWKIKHSCNYYIFNELLSCWCTCCKVLSVEFYFHKTIII